MRRVGFDGPNSDGDRGDNTIIKIGITVVGFEFFFFDRDVGYEVGNRPNVWCDEFWDLVNGFAQFIYALSFFFFGCKFYLFSLRLELA